MHYNPMHRHSIRCSTRRSAVLVVVFMFLTLARPAAAQAPISILAGMSASASSLRDSIVALARAQIGTRYRHGGASPQRGFDCSGLVQYVMARFQMILPRTAKQQAALGVVVDRDTSLLRPGDLLTFATSERASVSHIGIYIGGGRFIHASSVAGRVIESPLNRPPAPKIKMWRGVARYPLMADAAPTTAGSLPAPER